MSMRYFAHTAPKDRGAEDAWQPLADHLKRVAEMSERYASGVNDRLPNAAWAAGILHDLGKYSERFQARLRDSRIHGVNHWQAGASSLARAVAGRLAEAFAVDGHHTGLPDRYRIAEIARLENEEASGLPESLDVLRGRYSADLLPEVGPGTRPPFEGGAGCLWIRMLFSSLVDADYTDTAMHFSGAKDKTEEREINPAEWLAALQSHIARLWDDDSPLQENRDRLLGDCLRAAQRPPGLFSLTAPTGTGKTLASIAFALEHARAHGRHRRLIFILPFTTIVEQTADICRKVFPEDRFGPQSVLEHHSAREPAEDAAKEDLLRLTAETWNAPLIVTTQVQFFESLFSDHPGTCRKLHRIAGSVLVFDEVQSLPVDLLNPLYGAVKDLCDLAGCTAVLSTATPNALGDAARRLAVPGWSPAEIVTDPEALAARMRRVTFHFPEDFNRPTPLAEIASQMARESQALCVVNRKDDAVDLFRLLPPQDRHHLSTSLCPAHRQAVLAAIRRDLKDGRPCRLAATQCVEAGVDFDFPAVWRAAGPLHAIIQAAGRCNREGRREAKESPVRIFVSERQPPPGLYRLASSVTELCRNLDPADPLAPASISRYFSLLYERTNLDAQGITELERQLNFPEIAKNVRLVGEDTVPVLVEYGPDGSCVREELENLERLFGEKPMPTGFVMKLRRFSVSFYRREATKQEIAGAISQTRNGWRIWTGQYDPDLGCVIPRPEEMIL